MFKRYADLCSEEEERARQREEVAAQRRSDAEMGSCPIECDAKMRTIACFPKCLTPAKLLKGLIS